MFPNSQQTGECGRFAAPRSATHWHTTTDLLGRRISFITSNECGVAAVAIASIYDPHSAAPSCRMVDGRAIGLTEDDEPFPAIGLTVFGLSKHSRPTLAEMRCWLTPSVQIAVDAIREAMK